jgi:HEAT repeat protein
LLQALARDENSGVRIEALNGLLAGLGTPETPAARPDAEAIAILRDRMRNDPNNYVRLRSATALAQMVSAPADSSPEVLTEGPQP